MLHLRPEQLAALGRDARERFAGELSAFLREKFPSVVASLTQNELLRRVRVSMERAASHGLARRADVRSFVTFAFAIGPAFDRHPAVEAVLRDLRIPAEEKIDYLTGRVTPGEWVEARALGGEEVWESADGTGV
ncbi:MAG TPA: hypothetical protein VGQ36_08250 [Thermoanaerobaculia bacterium]|jgi:hypothetical protein|nr:hypothetical protein [Thermoanaerobaculia bacterium]